MLNQREPPRLLVVDDDPVIRAALLDALKAWCALGLVATVGPAESADHVRDRDFDLIMLDAGGSDASGLLLLTALKLVRPDLPVIIISGHGNEQWAVHAIQAGAADYIPAARLDALLVHAVERAIENVRLFREVERLNIDLVGMVSHDIRAPTANIIGFSDLLLEADETSGRPGDRAKVVRIRENGLFILRLIDDLIDMVRIDSGALRLVLARHDLTEVVRECLDRCAFFARGKQIHLALIAPSERTMVILDRPKVVQILSNLLSNAIKFSPESSTVTATARLEDGAVVFEVEDRGLGIPPAELDRLFKKFSVTSNRATRGEKGSGLGLYIVSEFTKLHSGAVHVASERGRGSTFTVRLPQVRAARPR